MTDPSTLEAAAGPTGTHTPGAFVWHELRTKDVAGAQPFYAALFGWTYAKSPVPGVDYHLIQLGERRVGGMFNSAGHDFPSHWGSFVSVPDVDEAADLTKAAGGELCAGPEDIPGVGRFAMIQDPQGAFVALYRNLASDPDSSDTQTGEFCWDQLNTTDMAAGAAFYQKVVGWTYEQPAADMGLFKQGDLMEASLGIVPAGVPPHWLSFIAVDDLTAVSQQAVSLGATVLMADLPAGPWGRFSVIQDPVGAVVGFFQGNES
jgi:predicted enzyme related to lactoylglutathione lyase